MESRPSTTSSDGYGSAAKTLHWVIVALVAVQFVISYLMPHIGSKTQPGTLINLHFSFGVVILVVMAIRLGQRLAHPVPLEEGGPRWERTAASIGHRLFYVLLLIGPFLGWAAASAHKLPVTVFGLVRLPDIAAPRARWALTAGDIHMWAMWATLALVAGHVAAVLYHQLARHDGTLRRMLPRG